MSMGEPRKRHIAAHMHAHKLINTYTHTHLLRSIETPRHSRIHSLRQSFIQTHPQADRQTDTPRHRHTKHKAHTNKHPDLASQLRVGFRGPAGPQRYQLKTSDATNIRLRTPAQIKTFQVKENEEAKSFYLLSAGFFRPTQVWGVNLPPPGIAPKTLRMG